MDEILQNKNPEASPEAIEQVINKAKAVVEAGRPVGVDEAEHYTEIPSLSGMEVIARAGEAARTLNIEAGDSVVLSFASETLPEAEDPEQAVRPALVTFEVKKPIKNEGDDRVVRTDSYILQAPAQDAKEPATGFHETSNEKLAVPDAKVDQYKFGQDSIVEALKAEAARQHNPDAEAARFNANKVDVMSEPPAVTAGELQALSELLPLFPGDNGSHAQLSHAA